MTGLFGPSGTVVLFLLGLVLVIGGLVAYRVRVGHRPVCRVCGVRQDWVQVNEQVLDQWVTSRPVWESDWHTTSVTNAHGSLQRPPTHENATTHGGHMRYVPVTRRRIGMSYACARCGLARNVVRTVDL